MRPSRYLKRLRRKTVRNLYKLRVLAEQSIGLNYSERDHIISYVTIESLNTWSNFSRTYFLSCSFSPFRENGSQITLSNPTIHSFHDAISAAMRRCRFRKWQRGGWGRRDEPPWFKPETLMKSCHEIGCSNYQDILSAFSVPSKVFEHLPKFRNFYAHRNDHTVLIAKNVASQYSIATHGQPSDILCTQAYGRPQILLLDWIDDISNVIELLCN